MEIATVEGLLLLLGFIVPGFVMNSTMNFVSPRAEDPAHIAVPRFLMLSALTVAAWWWLLPEWPPSPTNLATVSLPTWGFVVLVGPTMLGLLGGMALAKEWPRFAVTLLRIKAPVGAHSAWNYKFTRLKGGSLVIVALKSGSKVHGWFGPASMAASTLGRGDLYLQEIYRLSDTGSWEVIPRHDGVWLASDQIESIEFLRE